MDLQQKMSLQQEFESAVTRVNSLPGDQAAAHMTELYGLYKQATEGDHDTRSDAVDENDHDNPNGPKGLSQGQWDAWSRYKGTSQDDARRQYVAKVNELAGPLDEHPAILTGNGQPATAAQVQAAPGTASASPAAQAQQQAGQPMGGLQGDLRGGTPYGGEDTLKNEQ